MSFFISGEAIAGGLPEGSFIVAVLSAYLCCNLSSAEVFFM